MIPRHYYYYFCTLWTNHTCLRFICWALFLGTSRALSSSTVLDTASLLKMQQNKPEKRPQVSFSHVHIYVDQLKDLHVYKDLEDRLTGFVNNCKTPILDQNIVTLQEEWRKVQPDHFPSSTTTTTSTTAAFVPHNRDLVQQLLAGFGFRVTGARYGVSNTRSVLVTSRDPSGVQFLLTAKDLQADALHDTYRHFDAGKTYPSRLVSTQILIDALLDSF